MSTQTSLSRRKETSAAEPLQRRRTIAPPVDIYENDDEILVVADVPGARADGVTVRLEKDELTVHARRDEALEGEVLMGAAGAADYARTFLVPRGIDAEKIGAEMKGGVLTIHLPKSEAIKPRRIEVRAS